jgi:hypothetical protein
MLFFRSLETDVNFIVHVELTIWVDLVAFTVLCEKIGKAGCSPSQCGFHRQIGPCGIHAEGGTLTLRVECGFPSSIKAKRRQSSSSV